MIELQNPWFIAAAFGLAVSAFAWALIRASDALLDPVRRRLGAMREPGAAASQSPARRLFARFGTRLQPREGRRLSLAARMIQAGFRSQDAIPVLYSVKLLLLIAVPALIFATTWSVPQLHEARPAIALIMMIMAVVAWLLPNAFVDRRMARRKEQLMLGFPDALDLLVACTEAGLGLNAGLERIVEHMPASHPLLAQELSLVNAEIRAGVDRTQALRNLSDRTGLDEIRGLVSLITHSAKFGTGIAGTLRVYAEEFRDRRLQRAEELAAMVGTKLIFPLVGCLWPAFFIVAVGPAVIGVIRALSGVALPQ